MPIPGATLRVLMDYRLEPVGEDTRLIQTFSKAQGNAFGRLMFRTAIAAKARQAQRDIDSFGKLIEGDLAGRLMEH